MGGCTWLKRSEVLSHLRATGSDDVQRFERACLAKAVRETRTLAPGVLGAEDSAALQELDTVVAAVQDRVDHWQPKGGKHLRISKNGLGHALEKQAKVAAEGAPSTPAPTTTTTTSDHGAAQGPGQVLQQQGSSRGFGTSPAGFHNLTPGLMARRNCRRC